MKKTFLPSFVLAVAVAGVAQGAVTLFDFETPAEIKAGPISSDASRTFSIESRFASHGTNALHWVCTPWRVGLNEWPSFTLNSPVTDWTKYDRLCVDLVNLGEGGDPFSTFLAGPEGRIQGGLYQTTLLPSHGYKQFVVPLKNWPATANPTNIVRVHFFTTHPKTFDVYLDRVTLLEKGEQPPVPYGEGFARDLLPLMETRIVSAEKEAAEIREERGHQESYWRLREACARAGQDTTKMSVGLASSMLKVRPRSDYTIEPARAAAVRLARVEKESFQVIVQAGEQDLSQVRVTCGDLKRADGTVFAAANVKCAVTGYVLTKKLPPYRIGYQAPSTNAVGYVRKTKVPELGWWPDPILDYLSTTDVKGRDAQSFWVRVTCPENQPAGTYAGTLTVSAKQGSYSFPFTVRVNDFAVPKKSPLPLAISFSPGYSMQFATPAEIEESKLRRADPKSPINLWQTKRTAWCDFLADYYIPMDSIYHHSSVDPSTGKATAGAFYPDMLLRLKEQGRLGFFNLGYWSAIGKGPQAEAQWRASHLPRLRSTYEFAKRNGILDRAFIYGCDEAPKDTHGQVQRAVKILKEEFPGVPIFTTAYDHEFGVNTSLACMDWFCPLTPRFDAAKAAVARQQGRQVWWYICCGPRTPFANMFIEHAAIEGRLLMGAQTTRMRPDGFLYYAIAIWNGANVIQGSSAFTDWTARSWTTFHGDGSWTCCGPDGMPLATQRLENFRDGLEDYAYALELERRLKACPDPNSAWAKEARRLLAVPKDVTDTMSNYTDAPEKLLAWRNAMADLIEQKK